MTKQKYDLEERLLEYSVKIIKLVEQLPNTEAGNHIADLLLRLGTSAFPNHRDAQTTAFSKDFVHKLSIALKKLMEIKLWLMLIKEVQLIDKPDLLNDVLDETEELIKIYYLSKNIIESCV